MRSVSRLFAVAAFLTLLPVAASAQEGQIAGTVRDSSDAVMPGVLVEVTSPALIERVRSSTTDGSGQYRITNLPIGTYTVTFTLEGFSKQQRNDVVLTSGFTAPVNATMAVGVRSETVTVIGEAPTVDVQNARQVATFAGEAIRDLPTARNLRTILTLTPGLTVTGLGADCVGGVGVWCNNNIYNLSAHTATNDTDGGLQGRVMVNGTVINTGGGAGIMGMTGGYVADITNAQEVSVQISGALGESETGGAAINIVPRTGGNRFAGTFNANYTRRSFFSSNNQNYPSVVSNYPIVNDHDTSIAFGGPIKRDRLWFFTVGRAWGKEAFNSTNENIWDNKNAGIWGMNYQPDRSLDPLNFTNWTRNANLRLTYQATTKNKFDIFWDEGFTCQDPCDGAVASWAPRDGNWSGQVHPARLRQVTWTNPLSQKILLEAGIAANTQLYDFSYHRYMPGHQDIPRVVEFGSTVGMDNVSPLVNASSAIFGVQSGNLNNGPGGAAEFRNLDDYRPRASISYVSGSHHAKFGFDGGYFSQRRHNTAGDTRLTYRYDTPAATCLTTIPISCGNTSLYFPTDPTNLARRPVPTRVTINTGIADIESKVKYSALYLQDQWTMKRFTMSGALRYDHATSNYLETCIGPDLWVPVQNGGSYAGQSKYCTPPTDGVSYNDITPRWGATWDVFGTGKTSVKWNMGKYLSGAGISGIYADANPALRAVNDLTRNWTDTNGNRRVDCNLLNFNANGECGTPIAGQDSVRYGRDPLSLDAAGIPIGLATTQCGRREQGIPAAVSAYCAQYGDSLLEGAGKRRAEWQFGIGIQHEILPRLSAEVTYNRRKYLNLTVTDQLGVGCDRYNAQDLQTCLNNQQNYLSDTYDFFRVVVPANPGLPGGGGYTVRGLANPKFTFPASAPSAVTIMDELQYTWNGVDTNFVWRGPGGFRINGGTSTGRAVRDQCGTELGAPNFKARDGNSPACRPYQRWDTNVRGTATYTIPKVDVLASTVFQWRPGLELMALWNVPKESVIWEGPSAYRATLPCTGAQVGQVGCFSPVGTTVTSTNFQVNLLDPGDLYTDGYWLFDVKLGKNIKFAGKRLNVGVDIYNLFNNDVVRGIQQTFPADNLGVAWNTPNTLLSPRFFRLQMQLDF